MKSGKNNTKPVTEIQGYPDIQLQSSSSGTVPSSSAVVGRDFRSISLMAQKGLVVPLSPTNLHLQQVVWCTLQVVRQGATLLMPKHNTALLLIHNLLVDSDSGEACRLRLLYGLS